MDTPIHQFTALILDSSNNIFYDILTLENMTLDNLVGILEYMNTDGLSDDTIYVLNFCANFIIRWKLNINPEERLLSDIEIREMILDQLERFQADDVISNNLTEIGDFFSNRLVREYIFNTMVPHLLSTRELNFETQIEEASKRIPASNKLICRVRQASHSLKNKDQVCSICYEKQFMWNSCEKCKNYICLICLENHLKEDYRCVYCRGDLNETLLIPKKNDFCFESNSSVDYSKSENIYKCIELNSKLKKEQINKILINDFLAVVETKNEKKNKKKEKRRKNQTIFKNQEYKMKKKFLKKTSIRNRLKI